MHVTIPRLLFLAGCTDLNVRGPRAGKTTLLQILAGKFMVDRSMVCIIGDSPFHDLVRDPEAISVVKEARIGRM